MIFLDNLVNSYIKTNNSTLLFWLFNKFDNVVAVKNVVDIISNILNSKLPNKTNLIKMLISTVGLTIDEMNEVKALAEDLGLEDLQNFLIGYNGGISENTKFINSVNRILK